MDVGILNITNFATPNPFRYFFGQLRYGADLHDIYGRLIEKMAGRKGRLSFGGDAAPKTSKGLPKKVRLVDLFSGPVELDAQGKATVKLPVPDFNGTLRLMAVAATEDSYGSADREVVVAAPMIAELSAPRFMNWGDEARVALDLHNLSGGPASLKVRMPPVNGILVQNPEQDVQLADQEKKILTFNLTADRQFLGLADLRGQMGAEREGRARRCSAGSRRWRDSASSGPSALKRSALMPCASRLLFLNLRVRSPANNRVLAVRFLGVRVQTIWRKRPVLPSWPLPGRPPRRHSPECSGQRPRNRR